MKRILSYSGKNIEYEIKISKRTRTLLLCVHHDGRIVVTCPLHINENTVEKFISNKAEWIVDKITHFKEHPKVILTKGGKKDYLKHKEITRDIVIDRLNHFNKFYNLNWNKVSIRNTKSRWGSCSKKRNINFSYKLAFLPQELSDYIVVHELCHLAELNHSKNFWNLVSKTIPHHRELRKKLKTIY